jgi:hypothetical protein
LNEAGPTFEQAERRGGRFRIVERDGRRARAREDVGLRRDVRDQELSIGIDIVGEQHRARHEQRRKRGDEHDADDFCTQRPSPRR